MAAITSAEMYEMPYRTFGIQQAGVASPTLHRSTQERDEATRGPSLPYPSGTSIRPLYYIYVFKLHCECLVPDGGRADHSLRSGVSGRDSFPRVDDWAASASSMQG